MLLAVSVASFSDVAIESTSVEVGTSLTIAEQGGRCITYTLTDPEANTDLPDRLFEDL